MRSSRWRSLDASDGNVDHADRLPRLAGDEFPTDLAPLANGEVLGPGLIVGVMGLGRAVGVMGGDAPLAGLGGKLLKSGSDIHVGCSLLMTVYPISGMLMQGAISHIRENNSRRPLVLAPPVELIMVGQRHQPSDKVVRDVKRHDPRLVAVVADDGVGGLADGVALF